MVRCVLQQESRTPDPRLLEREAPGPLWSLYVVGSKQRNFLQSSPVCAPLSKAAFNFQPRSMGPTLGQRQRLKWGANETPGRAQN